MTVNEEASLDKSLTVPHQVVAEETRVNTVGPPASDTVSNTDNVRVALGLVSVWTVSTRAGGWAWGDFKVRLGPFVHMTGNEVSVISDLSLDDIVDVVTAARFGKAAHRSHCKK